MECLQVVKHTSEDGPANQGFQIPGTQLLNMVKQGLG
jgi:hypothetical protein